MSVTSALILRSIAQRCVSKDKGGPILRDARKSALLRMRPSLGVLKQVPTRSQGRGAVLAERLDDVAADFPLVNFVGAVDQSLRADRKSTRLNSSHLVISYAVFCLKK